MIDPTLSPHKPQVVGVIDTIDPAVGVRGWALAADPSSGPVDVVVYNNGEEIARATANQSRPDLERAGKGACAFALSFPTGMSFFKYLAMGFDYVIELDGLRIGRLVPGPSAVASLKIGLTVESMAEFALLENRDEYYGQLRRILNSSRFSADKLKLDAFFAKAGQTIGGVIKPGGKWDEEVAPLYVSVGLKSPAGDAIVGRDGYLFLTEGTNSVLKQLSAEPASPDVTDVAAAWIALFTSRLMALKARKCRYYQIIIPEKISTIPEYYPTAIKVPSPLLDTIESVISDRRALKSLYFPALACLKGSERIPFQRTGSHLSPYGAFHLFRSFLSFLGHKATLEVDWNEDVSEIGSGDTGLRFFGTKLYEETHCAKTNLAPPTMVENYVPDDGGHIGRRVIFANASNPSRLRVVVFGNSFFGIANQESLLWWFSRYFREVHFLWNPEFDFGYIDTVKPDLVIGQTIERFLVRVPKH